MLWKSGGVDLDAEIVHGEIPLGSDEEVSTVTNGDMTDELQYPVMFFMKVIYLLLTFINQTDFGNSPNFKYLSIEPPERFYPFHDAERHEEMRFQDQCDRMQSIADTSIGNWELGQVALCNGVNITTAWDQSYATTQGS
ncbi:hypothetical protein BC830DRAFT_1216312 [Chytriomyces sp. MP71]|nr:hypothetical protein BC830DRAFT_1216312 [Chytriomyces sp. MP71]